MKVIWLTVGRCKLHCRQFENFVYQVYGGKITRLRELKADVTSINPFSGQMINRVPRKVGMVWSTGYWGGESVYALYLKTGI